uniref:Lipoprotein n=1 Tax=viral metagenome TaxID=1070528 RepID=A0A6M3XNV6_9ZZZZ
MKRMFLLFLFIISLYGCAGSLGKITANDPLERGCSYIACAIVTHGILQILFRK